MPRIPALLLALAFLVLAGCGAAQNSSGQDSSGQDPASGEEPALIGTGKVADYDFSASTLDGGTFDGEDLAGRPAVLWFWAPWCPTCRAQVPTVSAVGAEHAGEVAVVGVGGFDSEAAIKELAAEIPDVTHLVDADGEVWQHFGVTAQSSYTVIDAEGEIIAEGFLANSELIDLVDRLAR